MPFAHNPAAVRRKQWTLNPEFKGENIIKNLEPRSSYTPTLIQFDLGCWMLKVDTGPAVFASKKLAWQLSPHRLPSVCELPLGVESHMEPSFFGKNHGVRYISPVAAMDHFRLGDSTSVALVNDEY
jgi:hypothetical protein